MTIAMPTDCRRPSLFSNAREFGTPLEFMRLPLATPRLLNAPRGDGRQIILLPGYQSPEWAMEPLAAYLRGLGYRANTWGLGVNSGHVDYLTDQFGARVESLATRTGGPITLIGWSLGGVIARETARLFGDHVREIITMGTPIIGGPKYTATADFYALQSGFDMDAYEYEIHARNLVGLPQPLTVIYSKSDGIVGWKAAVDIYNPHARNIQVRSTHFGLGVNARVWRIVADTLAAS